METNTSRMVIMTPL